MLRIIKDDLLYSLGEKTGIKTVLDYILPKGISTPSRQTFHRDLDMLYTKLDEKVIKELQVFIILVFVTYLKLTTQLQLRAISGPVEIQFTYLLVLSYFLIGS